MTDSADGAPRFTIGRRLDLVKRERISWRSRGRVARGKLTMLDGDPGLGKSMVTMDWAARVSRGDPLPGGEPQEERGVLLICGEDDPGDTIGPRIDAMGGDSSQITILTEMPVVDSNGIPLESGEMRLIGLPTDVPLIETAVELLGIGLIIIDPLFAFIDEGLNVNQDQDVRRALTPLVTSIQRRGTSVVAVRHLNKSAATNALYRGGGSIGVIGVARFGLVLAKAPDDSSKLILAATKSNLGVKPRALILEIEPVPDTDVAKINWLGEVDNLADELINTAHISKDQKDEDADSAEFLAEYLANGPASRNSILDDAKSAGLSSKSIERAKRAMGIKHKKVGAHLGVGSVVWLWMLNESTPDELEAARSVEAERRDAKRNPHNLHVVKSNDATSDDDGSTP